MGNRRSVESRLRQLEQDRAPSLAVDQRPGYLLIPEPLSPAEWDAVSHRAHGEARVAFPDGEVLVAGGLMPVVDPRAFRLVGTGPLNGARVERDDPPQMSDLPSDRNGERSRGVAASSEDGVSERSGKDPGGAAQ